MIAKAYIDSRFIGLMDDIESTNSHDVIIFIWENIQKGYYCTLQYIEHGSTRYFSPDFFNESTMDISDCEIDCY